MLHNLKAFTLSAIIELKFYFGYKKYSIKPYSYWVAWFISVFPEVKSLSSTLAIFVSVSGLLEEVF